MDIYAGNLPYAYTEDDLRDLFAPFGEVTSAKIIMDRETDRSKGFGFVGMADETAANTAIEELNGTEIDGRAIRVNTSSSDGRPQRRPGGGGGGGGGGRRSFGDKPRGGYGDRRR